MRLPNGDKAVIEESKLLDYCLSPHHPRGRHKARLFAASLGFTQGNADLLRRALLHAAATSNATHTKRNAFGDYYEIVFPCAGPTGSASISSIWIISSGTVTPRLVTCYPL